MIDWLTIVIALAIIAILIAFFGYLAMKINMSDPLTIGKKDDNNQLVDSINDKKKKDNKNKRKDQKKSKRENKDEEQQRTKVKEPSVQTSEETDDEREESEQESSSTAQPQIIETSSKARKRNKNKTRTATPPPPPPPSTRVESNLKNDKNPVTTRAPPVTHPKSAPKDGVELTKPQAKVQVQSSQVSNKQTLPPTASTTTKKTTQSLNTNEEVQKEQPFTTVGGNRHKTATPSVQQQTKSQVNSAPTAASIQQSSSVNAQNDQSAQRQQLPSKETPAQFNGLPTNPLPLKQQASAVPPKLADLVKVLPSSKVVVTELVSALDAFPLSADELDIIMHKIANKQSVVKQDWSKLQQGQKVDPQAHIGQVMDESDKAYQEDMKNNSIKRVKELTDELNVEKRRINDLLKEKNDNEKEIQILHAQLDSIQRQQPTQTHSSQPQIQTLQLQLQRLTEDNIHLNHQLAQQQQLTASNLINNGDSTNVQVRVLSDQIKKLSVDNANLEKKSHSNELLAKEAQKEKDDLIRYNEQLTQSLHNVQKDLQHTEEKLQKESNENRTLHMNQINEYKRRVEQLEIDNEQLRREEIVHVEPQPTTDIQTITLNTEEREQLEQEIDQLKQTNNSNQQRFEDKQREYNDLKQQLTEYKNKHDDLQAQENALRQEIERREENKNTEQQQQVDESRNKELSAKNAQIDTLRAELDEVKAGNDLTNSQLEERLRQEREKQRHVLTNLLSQELRNQLPSDNQDFDQWISSYRQIFESSKHTLQEESASLKRENGQLHRNMHDIENQLKQIEQTVQSKEETLLDELKVKDVTIETVRNENDQLNNELQHLRTELERLQSVNDASANEARALKLQFEERFLVATNSPAVIADESFELVKQPSPSLSPIVIDIRADQLNELIRSSKEALENQDSITQQLDRHLDDMHRSGTGETSTSNIDQSTVSSSSDHQS